MNARRACLAGAVVGMLVAGCGVADGPVPPLSDPVEILDGALSSAAALGTAHVRFELEATGGQQGLDGAAGDLDLDLDERELAGTVDLPPLLGGGRLSVLYADGELFARDTGGEWERLGGNGAADPLAFVPTMAKIVDALDAALDEPDTRASLVGIAACDEGSCYRLRVDVAPEGVWLTLQRLQGLEGLDVPMPDGVPPLELEAWVDRAELRIVGLRGVVVDPDGGRLVLDVALSAHDRPVDLSPPPDEVTPGG